MIATLYGESGAGGQTHLDVGEPTVHAPVAIAEVRRFGQHQNSFGFLRLLFASLVIVAHTPALFDGNLSREPLTRIFGTITFGEFAVDGFFLISGFLITGSWLQYPRLSTYFRKRIVRIYPAFIICSLITFLLVAPLSGVTADEIRSTFLLNLRLPFQLQVPIVTGAFEGAPFTGLNNAAWTIPYEFRCYLLVALLGLLGVFKRPRAIAFLVVAAYVCFQILPSTWSFEAYPISAFYSAEWINRCA